jgi:hypothetical protein
MELATFVDELRSAYVQEFVSAFQIESTKPGKLFAEITFQISGGVHKRLYVVDLVRRNGESDVAVELGPTSTTIRGPATFAYKEKEIIFEAVSWDAVKISAQPPVDWSQDFENWFDRWLDPEKPREDGEITTGIIHSVAFAQKGLQVDFGTAPAAAAMELIQLLQDHGAEVILFANARE